MIPFNVPFATGQENAQIAMAMADNKLSGNGHFTKQCLRFFKEEYGFQNAFLTTSCTAAIQMIAIALEFEPGDEIIIPSYTFSSTPNPFLIHGATVRFADSQPDHPNASLASIESLITKNTKAIMIVHYGGYAVDMDRLKSLCTYNDIALIEDAAQCIDGFHNGKPMGSFGDFSVFSFHETKNIHCGEGGLLVINNPIYVDKAATIWNYGTNKKAFLSGEVDSYEWTGIGLSFCLSELNAAYLSAQLPAIKSVTAHRKLLWETYYKALETLQEKGHLQLPTIEGDTSSYHTFYVCTKDRKAYHHLQQYLLMHQVLAVQHYYPLHESKYALSNDLTSDLPNSRRFGKTLLRFYITSYQWLK